MQHKVEKIQKNNKGAVIFTVDKNGDILNYLNVGTGIDLSIAELAEEITLVSGFKGIINWDKNKPDGTPKKQLDVRRLKSHGWRAGIPLEKGLRRTVALFRDETNRPLSRF